MPESLGTWNLAKGTVARLAAAAMAEPARSMHPRPLQTSHYPSRRYLRTWLDRVPLLPLLCAGNAGPIPPSEDEVGSRMLRADRRTCGGGRVK